MTDKRARLITAITLLVLLAGCGGEPAPPSATTIDLLPLLAESLVVEEAVNPGAGVCADLRGDGWWEAETTGQGRRFAWMKGSEARLNFRSRATGPGVLFVHVSCLDDGAGANHLRLTINGTELKAQALSPRWQVLRFDVPAGVISGVTNTIDLAVDRAVVPAEIKGGGDRRLLGAAVGTIRWVPAHAANNAEGAVDPFAESSRCVLTPTIYSQLRLAHPAGATLWLQWTRADDEGPGELYVDDIDSDGNVRPLGTFALAGRSATIELPTDLPSTCRIKLHVTSETAGDAEVELTEATLRMPAAPLNVILIVIDTLRPDYLGCYGADGDPSPRIDALAADGILFETAYCPSPITGPSHASLFTSRLPSQHGIVNNVRGVIPRSPATLPEVLSDAGLATGAAVSISPIDGRYGFARGFDRYDCDLGISWILASETVLPRGLDILAGLNEPFFFWLHLSDPHEPYDAHDLVHHEARVLIDGKEVAVIPTSTYTPTALEMELPEGRPTEILIRSAAPFRTRNVSLRADGGDLPTLTLQDDDRAITEYHVTIGADGHRQVRLLLHLADSPGPGHDVGQRYTREVSHSDHHVGLLLDELRERGLYEESLILFTADHGEALGQHGHTGHVHTVYDAMVRIPLIIKTPASWGRDGGVRRQDPASLLDILPTVLSGLGMVPRHDCAGRDLLAHDAEGQKVELFLETHQPESERTLFGLTDGRCKIIFEPETTVWEFFDLRADPRELENLFDPDDPEHQRWRDELWTRLDTATRGEAAPPDAIDGNTREMLRSLGY